MVRVARAVGRCQEPDRPSEAPLLARLLTDTQAELVRTAAAAAMWQTPAEIASGGPTDGLTVETAQPVPTRTAVVALLVSAWRSACAGCRRFPLSVGENARVLGLVDDDAAVGIP